MALIHFEYIPPKEHAEGNSDDSQAKKYNSLQAEITKRKRALERLEELYLYSDDSMPQKDYLIRCRTLSTEIDKFTQESNLLQKGSIFMTSISDEQFLNKATHLLFNKAINTGNIDFQELAMNSGNKILKDFINTVIKNIVVLDGHITQIEFVNASIHSFRY